MAIPLMSDASEYDFEEVYSNNGDFDCIYKHALMNGKVVISGAKNGDLKTCIYERSGNNLVLKGTEYTNVMAYNFPNYEGMFSSESKTEAKDMFTRIIGNYFLSGVVYTSRLDSKGYPIYGTRLSVFKIEDSSIVKLDTKTIDGKILVTSQGSENFAFNAGNIIFRTDFYDFHYWVFDGSKLHYIWSENMQLKGKLPTNIYGTGIFQDIIRMDSNYIYMEYFMTTVGFTSGKLEVKWRIGDNGFEIVGPHVDYGTGSGSPIFMYEDIENGYPEFKENPYNVNCANAKSNFIDSPMYSAPTKTWSKYVISEPYWDEIKKYYGWDNNGQKIEGNRYLVRLLYSYGSDPTSVPWNERFPILAILDINSSNSFSFHRIGHESDNSTDKYDDFYLANPSDFTHIDGYYYITCNRDLYNHNPISDGSYKMYRLALTHSISSSSTSKSASKSSNSLSSSSSDSISSTSSSSNSISSSSSNSSESSISYDSASEYLVGEFCRSELKGENVDIQYRDGIIYVANNYHGPLTFKLKGRELVHLPNTFDQTPTGQGKGAGDVRETWSEGFYLYVCDYLFGLKVYEPHSLTLLDQSALPQATCIWGKLYNSLVFVGTDNGSLAVYYFNGIELTRKDIVFPPGAKVINIDGYGTLDNLYIYVTTGMFLVCYKYNSVTEKLELIRQEATSAVDAWAEEEFVYVAGWDSGLKAYDRLMLNREATTPATKGTEFPTTVKHCAANNLGAIHGGRIGKFIRDQENKVRRNKLIVGVYGVLTKAFIWRKLKKKETVCLCEAGSLSAIPAKDWKKLKKMLIQWIATMVGGVVVGWVLKAIFANQEGDMESYDMEDISMSSFSSLSNSSSSNSSERSWSSASSNSVTSQSSLSSNSSTSFESFSPISDSSDSISSTNVTKPDIIIIDDVDDSDDMNDFVISGDKIYDVVNATTKVELYLIIKTIRTKIDENTVDGNIISLTKDRKNYVVLSGNGILIVYGIRNDKLVRLSETNVGPANKVIIDDKGNAVVINTNGDAKIIKIDDNGNVTIIRTDTDNDYIDAVIKDDKIILITNNGDVKIIKINPDNTLTDITVINDENKYIKVVIENDKIILITDSGDVKIIKVNPDNTITNITFINDDNIYVDVVIEDDKIILITDEDKIKIIVINPDDTITDIVIDDEDLIYGDIFIRGDVIILCTIDNKIIISVITDGVLVKMLEDNIGNTIIAKAIDEQYFYVLDSLGVVHIYIYIDGIAKLYQETFSGATNLYINDYGLFIVFGDVVKRYRFNGTNLIELFAQMLVATDKGVILYDYRGETPVVLDEKEIGFTISVLWHNGFWLALNAEGWLYVYDVIDDKLVEIDKKLIKKAVQLSVDENGNVLVTTDKGFVILKIGSDGKLEELEVIELDEDISIIDSVIFKDMIIILTSDGKALVYRKEGMILLTTKELGYLPIGLATDGRYVYILDGYGVVYIYTLDDNGVLTFVISKDGFEGAININSNSQGIFISFGKNGIKAFVFDGTDFIDVLDFDNGFYGTVVVIGDFVFYATDLGVMIYLTDDTGNMTYVDLIKYKHGVENIWTDGTYLYVKDNDGNFDIYGNVGGTWTLLKRMLYGSDWTAINAANNKVYIAKGSVVYIYYFNGSELILISSFTAENNMIVTDIKIDGDTLILSGTINGLSALLIYKFINGVWVYVTLLHPNSETVPNTYINGKYVYVVAEGGGAILVYELINGELVLVQTISLPEGKFICMVVEGDNVFISTDWGCYVYAWRDGQLVLIGFRKGYIYRGMVIKNGVIYGGKGYGGGEAWIWFNFEELSKNLIFNARTTNN